MGGSQDERKTVLDMFESIREAFGEILQENVWMDEATKRSSLEKIQKVNVFNGFSDFILEDWKLDDFYSDVLQEEKRRVFSCICTLPRAIPRCWRNCVSGRRIIQARNWCDAER